MQARKIFKRDLKEEAVIVGRPLIVDFGIRTNTIDLEWYELS